MTTKAITAWLSGFLFTQAVEVPLYVAAMRAWADEDAPFRPRLPAQIAVAFGASLITHPVVWFVIPRIPGSYELMMVRAELFAVVVEALYLYALGVFRMRRAAAVSLLANGASFSLGLLSRWLFGWP